MTQWYYRDFQSKKIGPLSTEEFEGCIADGSILPNTRVWRSGLIDWTTYEALLAHDASCLAVASGPHSSAAPHSSSRTLAGGPAASATHLRHDTRHLATPSSTPQLASAQAFELCSCCGEEMSSHLFAEHDSRRMCGDCIRKAKAEAKVPNANWLTKHLLLLVIVAGTIAAIRIGFLEFGTAPTAATKSLPVTENLTVAATTR